MSIEAMKQALAKFESLWEIGIDAVYRVELLPEIQALRQAIEQAKKQEPVDIHCPSCLHPFAVVPVAEREWVGLTDEEMSELYNKNYDKYDTDMTYMDFYIVQREVEAKLREKNGG
jgi:hypothetical protein